MQNASKNRPLPFKLADVRAAIQSSRGSCEKARNAQSF
jgi:hypothetical protein